MSDTDTLFQQWQHYEKTRRASVADQMAFHRAAQKQIALTVQTVLDHPGWQIFVEHLTALRGSLQAARERANLDLIDALGLDVERLRLQIKALDGEIKGLTAALEMIPGLVAAGEPALT